MKCIIGFALTMSTIVAHAETTREMVAGKLVRCCGTFEGGCQRMVINKQATQVTWLDGNQSNETCRVSWSTNGMRATSVCPMFPAEPYELLVFRNGRLSDGHGRCEIMR